MLPPPERRGRFVYKSGTTDVIAWVLEAATGKRFADLVSERLWKPIGAERSAYITVDTGGFTADELMSIEASSVRAGAHRHLTVDGRSQVFDRIITRLIQGNVRRGGLVELPFGTPLRELVEDFGGGTASGRPVA